jgi:hypothetical protein
MEQLTYKTQFEVLSINNIKLKSTHALFVDGVMELVSCDDDCCICDCRYELPQTTQTYSLLINLKPQITMHLPVFADGKVMYILVRGHACKKFCDLLTEKRNPLKFLYQLSISGNTPEIQRLYKIKKTNRHSESHKHNPFIDLPDITPTLTTNETSALFHKSTVYRRYLEIKNEVNR